MLAMLKNSYQFLFKRLHPTMCMMIFPKFNYSIFCISLEQTFLRLSDDVPCMYLG